MAVKVIGLNIFPIKSCHALQVDEVELDSHGVVDDRRFMLVDGNNRFVSQRKFPKLATVTAKFVTAATTDDRVLHVSAPRHARGDLRFEPVLSGDRVEAGVWEDRVMVVDQGEEPARWFSELIGHGGTFVRLVASAEREEKAVVESESAESAKNANPFHRTASNLPAPFSGRLNANLALTDAGPVSMVSEESLADVNERLQERQCNKVPLNRFRMNIEISGCSKPFEEDEWLIVQIGTTPFLSYTNAEVRKDKFTPSKISSSISFQRCKMTGIDQETGEQDKLGPLEILRAYRAPRGPTHAMFGQLMIPLHVGGKIHVGDPVTIIDRKKK